MIKANELRIGNWVLTDEGPYQIKHISNNDEWENGIALSPEILEKVVVDKDFFEIIKFRDGYSVSDNEGYSILGEPIYYVHQLQNLYFALTGSELEIKDLTKTPA